MAVTGLYIATANFTPGAAVNVALELQPTSAHPIEVVEVQISQEASTTSTAFAVSANYSTGAATGWTTSTITAKDANDYSSLTANCVVKAYSSGTSTDGTGAAVRERWGLNTLSIVPFMYIPKDTTNYRINGAHFWNLKFVVAPPASTAFNITVRFIEY